MGRRSRNRFGQLHYFIMDARMNPMLSPITEDIMREKEEELTNYPSDSESDDSESFMFIADDFLDGISINSSNSVSVFSNYSSNSVIIIESDDISDNISIKSSNSVTIIPTDVSYEANQVIDVSLVFERKSIDYTRKFNGVFNVLAIIYIVSLAFWYIFF